MKKALTIVLAVLMVVCFAACSTGGGGTPEPAGGGEAPAPPSGGEATTGDSGGGDAPATIGEASLKLAHGHAPQSVIGLQYQLFADKVAELSGGNMTVEIFPGGTLLTDPETLDGVMDGVVDIAHVFSSFASGTVKDIAPLEMYGFYVGDDWQGFLSTLHPVMNDIYEPFGVKFLASPYVGKNAFICTERQIMEPADMKGLTFRSAGTWYGKCIEAFGGAATQISFADMTTAFERGTVHGTVVGWNVAYPLGLYESAPYFTKSFTQTYFCNTLMNADSYNKLSPEQQAVIDEASAYFDLEGERLGVEMIADYRVAIEENGNSFLDLNYAQELAFLDLAEPLYDQMTDLSPNGQKLVGILKQERDAWRESIR